MAGRIRRLTSILHILDSKDFKHNVRTEWISIKEVKPLRIEAYKISDLNFLWRKSNEEELKEFLKDRSSWEIPKREKNKIERILKKKKLKAFKTWEK